jgi:hypothetical protein
MSIGHRPLFAQTSKVEYAIESPNGGRSSFFAASAGRHVSFGSSVHLQTSQNCQCIAELVEIRIDGESKTVSDGRLPVRFSTGASQSGRLGSTRPGTISLRVKVTGNDALKALQAAALELSEATKTRDEKAKDAEAASPTGRKPVDDAAAKVRAEAEAKQIEAEEAAGKVTDKTAALRALEQQAVAFEEVTVTFDQPTWWTVADTIAYAVMRETGNTAIAGAGVFMDPLALGNGLWNLMRGRFPNYARGQDVIQASIVVHLLPPAEEGSAADIGVAPVGFGFFGNRLVMGVGWNISRRGLRPTNHNRYVYLGFSASELLKPKLPGQQ